VSNNGKFYTKTPDKTAQKLIEIFRSPHAQGAGTDPKLTKTDGETLTQSA